MTKTPTAKGPTARERLLSAADELFYAEGVRTVGIDRIIEHAGVAKASLYNTFGGKEQLVRAYLDSRHARITERLLRGVNRADTPRERLLAVFDAQGELFTERSYHGCAFVAASAEAQPGSSVEEASDTYRAWIRTLFTDLARDSRRPGSRGTRPATAPPVRRERPVRTDGPRPLVSRGRPDGGRRPDRRGAVDPLVKRREAVFVRP